jgi:uncharacterized protein YoaH (UPF0181 family)
MEGVVKGEGEELMATAKQKAISAKISKLRHEGMSQKQAVAVGLSMLGASKPKLKKKKA